MLFRFTIRDIFWLIFVLALGVGWWLDHRHLDRQVSHYELLMFRSGVPDQPTQASPLR
ncbi:MAG TPA: hypothetical protein VMJ32_13370 [Pirellulales bacterium]|nr:hypothetical protein [Pirellulales bacterium]